MVKNSLILLVIVATFFSAAAQTVQRKAAAPDPFWAPSLEAALQKAQASGDMVFVRHSPDDKVLHAKAVLDSLKQFCAAGVYLGPGDTGTALFSFVMSDGTPLYRYKGSALPTASTYLEGLRQALDRKWGMEHLRILQAERLLGDKDEDKLRDIILERTKEGLPADSLLEEYVLALPQDSLASFYTLRFLALEAPILNTGANQTLRQDPELFKQVWLSLAMEDRIRINNEVITKTWKNAVADTSQEEAQLAATFAANTNQSATAKVRAFQGVMLEYYFGVADTGKFIDLAGTYYDRFLMHLNVDSLRQQDSIFHRKDDLSVARFVSAQLTKGAGRVCDMTTIRALLNLSSDWVDRAIALYPSKEALDTKARIQAKYTGTRH
jgi:hypothetical protein